ncbi:hypothetical protein LRP52_44540 [Photobacterium sp. ZSDE20]|uniref:Uncharacterized protein n=1 Tax=Photobacterium pectinilyticum TaxID=2906793 RepID=A0ABT1NAE4_9GAMM|nr:hypothetical protein [Photobacterium sp. ZSDE20]MCQ1061107.1 hypothetical protein [Photobacterium sp. ZSDE20]MDD1829239.1 hypothetical protein [Photobacterium sp. ZSDE20]
MITTYLRRLKVSPLLTMKQWLITILKRLFNLTIRILAHPLMTLIVLILQLVLGAFLGVQFSHLNFEMLFSEYQGFSYVLTAVWAEMNSGIKSLSIAIAIVSLVKASADVMKAYLDKRIENKQKHVERLMPPGKEFPQSYINRLRHVLDYRSLIDGLQIDPMEAIIGSLHNLRALAVDYDALADDSISINLMLVMRADEIEDVLEQHWEGVNIFFDGASPRSACAQIDGILTPIAVAHKDSARSYIGSNKQLNQPLLLPIVEGEFRQGKTNQRVIGAPTAFSSGVYQYYPMFLRSVENWLYTEQRRFISTEQADALYKYYVEDSSARSLLSVPINSGYELANDNNELVEERTTLLVLNMYCRHENLLRGDPSIFLSLTQPIIDTIAYAFDSWMQAAETEMKERELHADDEDATSPEMVLDEH